MAAVQSMASLQLTLMQPFAPLLGMHMGESLMGRHVASLGSPSRVLPLTADSLFVLARLMAHLRELHCAMPLVRMETMQSRLAFPVGLRQLELQLQAGSGSVADANAAIEIVGHLPLLESLQVRLPTCGEQVSFAPLSSLPLLRDLRIILPHGGPELSDAQVAELRAMPLLRRLDVDAMSTALLRRLLAQPHTLQWQRINLLYPLHDESAALLPQLPSLTHRLVTCSHATRMKGAMRQTRSLPPPRLPRPLADLHLRASTDTRSSPSSPSSICAGRRRRCECRAAGWRQSSRWVVCS